MWKLNKSNFHLAPSSHNTQSHLRVSVCSWHMWNKSVIHDELAGKATHALRCMRTIAGELLQLFSLIIDIIINKSKICCKSDSVARVKNWIGENISRPPGQINPMKSFLQETCRVASELFSPIQFFTLATESLLQQILLLLTVMSLITENNCRSSPAIVLTQRSAWVAFPAS